MQDALIGADLSSVIRQSQSLRIVSGRCWLLDGIVFFRVCRSLPSLPSIESSCQAEPQVMVF